MRRQVSAPTCHDLSEHELHSQHLALEALIFCILKRKAILNSQLEDSLDTKLDIDAEMLCGMFSRY